MEQQIETVTEEMCNRPKDYDWNVLEEVSDNIENKLIALS